ncbi:MAG: hypothetical protein K2Y22_06520 [Candidatus Obscuribacterales bacterium]|nr:hypothetical protein [Candidatus Obscuribacterales bacterium]
MSNSQDSNEKPKNSEDFQYIEVISRLLGCTPAQAVSIALKAKAEELTQAKKTQCTQHYEPSRH